MRRWRFYYFLAPSILIFFIVLQYPQVSRIAQTTAATIFKPFLSLGASVREGINDLRFHFSDFWNAVAKQREYLEKIANLKSQLIRLQEMERENARLKKLLDFSHEIDFKTIGTRVIGEDNTPWRRIVILDKGSRKGLKTDMVLVTQEGLAGRILDVGPTTARAILLPDPDSRVSALTSTSRVQGVVAGTGMQKLVMKYLALDAELTIGEDVITSGVGSIFPKGLRIGRIESIEKDPDGLHLQAFVIPSVAFSKLEETLCLISSPSK